MRPARMFCLIPLVLCFAWSHARSQSQDMGPGSPVSIAATSATVVPMLVRYEGVAQRTGGAVFTGTTNITFLVYKDAQGGSPLWIETQSVQVGPTGHYEAYLGSTYSSGLPADLFGSGEARWIEVQITGEPVQPRTLLSSVPYALKAADAATLGGLPASAFALAGTTATTAITGGGVTSDAASNVTTTGGTSFYVPRFNGTSTVVSSQIYDNGTSVGIGDVPNASARLDVNGAMIMRGNMQVTRTGNATTSTGYPSYGFQFYSNAYNSSTKTGDNPYFQLQSEPTGNDTASPSATFNLLFANNGGKIAETGFSINPNGTINFASSQTFPATSSSGTAVDGTSSSGTGVQGTSSSGTGAAGSSTSANGVLGYTVGNTLNTAGVYGVAGAGNSSKFSGIAGVWGDANAHVGVFGSSTQYDGVFGQSQNASGVEGSSNTNFGVIGGTNDSSSSGAGVYGYSNTAAAGVAGKSAYGDGANFTAGTTVDGSEDGAIGVTGTGGTAAGSQFQGGVGGSFQGGASSVTIANELVYSGAGVEGTGGEDDQGIAGLGGAFFGGNTFSQNGSPGLGLFAIAGYNYNSNAYGATAAQFDGDIDVNGTLLANSKNSKIDDPRDPANKYLNHTSIESSEMLNLYTGNVTTNASGVATVSLPDWFETINGDFRYQLTILGKKAQAWVSQEVENGKFEISTDTPGVKVSWQITAVRHDPYAKAHPLVVEQVKDSRERGLYRNPELYGQPKEKQIDWHRNSTMMQRMEAQHAAEEARRTRIAGAVTSSSAR